MTIKHDCVLAVAFGVPLGPGEAVEAHPPIGVDMPHLKTLREGGRSLFPEGRQCIQTQALPGRRLAHRSMIGHPYDSDS